MASEKQVTYTGPDQGAPQSDVFITPDGKEFRKGRPVDDVDAETVEFLENYDGHNFEIADSGSKDAYASLNKKDLEQLAAERGVTAEGTGSGGAVTVPDLQKALRDHDKAQGE